MSGDTKAMRALAERIRQGKPCSDDQAAYVAALLEWDDGIGHPDDVEPLAFALGGLRQNGTAEQRLALADMVEDEADHREALRAARNGNPHKVLERQKQGKRIELPLAKKRGAPSTQNRRVEAFVWLTTVERMNRRDAINVIQKAERCKTQSTAVERDIDKKKDKFKPDFWFEVCAQRWREGCREVELRPPLLRGN